MLLLWWMTGLVTTTKNFAAKNAGLYNNFATAYALNPAKVGDWKDKADEVQARSNELYEFMHECKIEIVEVKDEDAIHDGEMHLGRCEGKGQHGYPGRDHDRRRRRGRNSRPKLKNTGNSFCP